MSRELPPLQRRAATVRRVDALFQGMSTDYLLREQFVTNPAQVLADYLHGTQLPPEQASVTNQLIYAVLADRDMLSWLHDYANQRRGAVPTGGEFLGDFSRAIVERGAGRVVTALVRAAGTEHAVAGLDADLLHYFFNVGAAELVRAERDAAAVAGTGGDEAEAVADEAVAGDDVVLGEDDLAAGGGTLTAVTWTTFTPGTGTGTGGTSTGFPPITTPITNPFTVTGTNPFPDPFTGTTAHHIDETLEVLPQFGPEYVMVTLDAVADYAARLRDIGALDELG
jgi:hypothetical protein